MRLAPIAFLLLLSAAYAATPIDMLEQLRTELRTELRSALDKGNGENNQRLLQIESLLVEQLPAKLSVDYMMEEPLSSVIRTLGQIRSLTRVAKTEELCQSLILELRLCVIANNKRFKESLDAAVKDALLTGLKARTAKDLDAPLLTLAKLQKQSSQEDYRVVTQPLATVTSILMLLQDSMLPQAAMQKSRSGIVQLASMTEAYAQQVGDMMPMSEFMVLVTDACARIDPDFSRRGVTLAEISRQSIELLRGVKRVEEIADAHQQMQALCPGSTTTPPNFTEAAQALGRMHRFYEDLKAGVATSFASLDVPTPTTVSEASAGLRDLLIRKALSHVLRVAGDSLQREEENVSAYLGRMIQESQKNSDWPLLTRTLDTVQSLHITGLLKTNDSLALRMVLAAVSHERAQIYSGAAAYYFGALRTGSQAVPSELIGIKLETIRKEHPQDYEAGQNIPIPDPTAQRTGGYTISASQRISLAPPPTSAPSAPKAGTTPKVIPAPVLEKKPPEAAKPESANSGAKP